MEKTDFFISQFIDQWENKIIETTELFGSLGAGNSMLRLAPCKNRVIYLLGHLLVVHDRMFEILEIDERKFDSYDDLFLTPQHASNIYPDYDLMLVQWKSLNDSLTFRLKQFTSDDWLAKHRFVSEDDFSKNKKRNKFSVLLSRNAHLFHHAGQLSLVQTTCCD